MNKIRKNIFTPLCMLACICWLAMGHSLEAADNAPALEYIYMDEDGTGGQIIIASVAIDEESFDGAQLTWEGEDGIESISAVEIVEGYAAFLTDDIVIDEGQMRSLILTYEGEEHVIDIQAFREADDTVTAALEEDQDAEVSVAESADEIANALSEAETAAENSGNADAALIPGNGLNGTSDDIVVVLDPGHGGSDGGASRTWDGVTYVEKELTLKIAKYVKAELETYAGVTVYMTRTTDVAVALQDRVDYASSVGADVLVSIHINSTSSDSTTATGAEVMVSKGNYNASQATETAAIAEAILAELESIGFTNRGLVYKLSETGNTYPNGKLADYYAIVRYSVLAGFPGMIVEHGFISNQDDCEAYFSTNAKLKKIGVADATAIAKYYGLVKASGAGWYEEDGGWYYMYEDGTRAAAGWLDLNGVRYYIDSDGYRVTGWQKFNRKKYYFDDDGVMQTGSVEIDGKLYYFGAKGVMFRSFKRGSDGKYYYARKNGVLRTGWQTINGKTYYFAKKTGASRTGWAKIGKYYYYFAKNGRMRKGMVTIDQATYYLDKNGRRLTGFVSYNNRKYYFSEDTGEMLKKTWVKYQKKWYYIGKNGYALQSTARTIGGIRYKFDSNGICTNK